MNKLLKFTHANLQQPIYVAEHLIFSHYYSPAHKATHLLANGGAIVPVLESAEEVSKILESSRTTTTSGVKKNVRNTKA